MTVTDAAKAVDSVKSLTLTNALVIVLIGLVALPAYISWRFINDPALLDRVMSAYDEQGGLINQCSIGHVQRAGDAKRMWMINIFKVTGAKQWFMGVKLSSDPPREEQIKLCEELGRMVSNLPESDK
jgi:hypothetical protein